MSNDTEVAALERGIAQAKEAVESGQALVRLRANRDFRRLITDGYFSAEAIRLVHLKADPAMQTEPRQKAILSQIDAIGTLHAYFLNVMSQAELGAIKIDADTATLEEMAAEELGVEELG